MALPDSAPEDPAAVSPANAPGGTPALLTENLTVAIGDTHLLSPVSITLPAGRNLVVGGDNGSGKTTFLSLITGLRSPSSGTIAVHGLAPDDRDPDFRRMVTGLIGRAPISRELTVIEHLESVAMSWSLPDPHTAAARTLEEFGIDFLAERFGHEMSTGQAQLMQLAMVLIRPARLIVLDEPEQRLDASRLRLVTDILADRARRGATLVLATHSPQIIDRLGDQRLILERAQSDRD